MDVERAQTSVSPASPQPGTSTPTESSKHDHLISEVEATEGQLGPILRTLYDCDEQEEFLDSLSTRIKNHEKEIERMCNKNYQWFIESVSELHKVKSEANKIKRKITEANTIIQDTGLELMSSAEDLYHARQVQKNIVATLETLNKCIPVLHEYHKLNEQMNEKQYYSALKTLEQLEHTLLPPVKGYIFSDLLSEQIPRLRQSIQDSSKAELTDFLTNVRNQAVGIGEVAMHQAHRHSTLELSQDVSAPLQQNAVIDPEVCASDLVDFSPVYRCLHIFSVLGKKDEFTKHYRTQRRKQVRLAIKPQGTWRGDINDFKRFFFGIVGFFVVEDTVLHTSQTLVSHQASAGGEERDEGLVSRPIVHEFWFMASAEVLAVLRSTCNAAKDYHLLLKVKELVVWFCHTMRGYGFEVDKLYEVLLEIREQYDELLMMAWGGSFSNIFENDDYNQFEVTTDEQFQGVIEIFPYQDPALAKAPFPRRFPFSAMVYMIYEQLRRFVLHCNDYASKINLSQTEIDECVRKSVNLLLSRTMSSCLSELIQGESMTIPQLVQIWINAEQMEKSIGSLETFIAKTTKTEGEGITAGKLYGVTAFKESRTVAEHKIIEKLKMKMSEIMEGASYDFMSKEQVTTQSEFLGDCLRLLSHTFTTLQPLPDQLCGQICLEAIKTLATMMESLLLSSRNLKISIKGLSGFQFDLKECKKFVQSSIAGISSLKQREEEAMKSFARLSGLLNLCESGEWTLYMNELQQPGPRKYPELPPKVVHNLLFKIRQAEKKKKKIHIKRPGAKKDEKKRVLLALKEYMQLESTDGAESSDSDSELGGGGIRESPVPRI